MFHAGVRVALGLALWSAGLGCSRQKAEPGLAASSVTPVPSRVREPAVAGSFYTDDSSALREQVDGLLRQARTRPRSNVAALICPHAGYKYSGPIAAECFAAIKGFAYERVVVLSPSHRVAFVGAAIAPTKAFRTPLGLIPLWPNAAVLAAQSPFALDSEPHRREHALEVQLPFLQRALGSFQLLPIVMGDVEPKAVADALAASLDRRTLVVASSDLSHYHPYAEAVELDRSAVEAIMTLDPRKVRAAEACGKDPIAVVAHLAKRLGWVPELLDYRNSGDTAGDKSRVVGYAAIALSDHQVREKSARDGNPGKESGVMPPQVAAYSTEERVTLLKLARSALVQAVRNGKEHPKVLPLPAHLMERKGCFVTLTKQGNLRGCIGNIFPDRPLGEAIVSNARSAALRDSRFPPVTPEELSQIAVEVSVLSVPAELPFTSPEDLVRKLRPYQDGVVLDIGSRRSTFLPQVWEQLPNPQSFLEHLSAKAGLAEDAYRGPGVRVSTYQAEAFHESEYGLAPSD